MKGSTFPSRTIKNELDKLVKQGFIVPLGIDEPSEWCNLFVCVQKPNGKIRLYLDPTQLNKYIVYPHHNAKLVEDLLPKLSGAKLFSMMDACSSFLMMWLSKESSYMTTFATMFSRYRYVHIPMGASLSSDCFQYKMYQIFGPIPQSCGITNDLVIYSYSEMDHDQVLFQVLRHS